MTAVQSTRALLEQTIDRVTGAPFRQSDAKGFLEFVTAQQAKIQENPDPVEELTGRVEKLSLNHINQAIARLKELLELVMTANEVYNVAIDVEFRLPSRTREYFWRRVDGECEIGQKTEKVLNREGSFRIKLLEGDVAIKKLHCGEMGKYFMNREKLIYMMLDHEYILGFLGSGASSLYLEKGVHDFFNCIYGDCEHRGASYAANSLSFLNQVAKALEYLHSKGIFHQDLKPENILITLNNIAKLFDFGGSAIGRDFDDQVISTPFYYPFRKTTRDNNDIWALGIVAAEVVVRRLYDYSQDLINDIAQREDLTGDLLKIRRVANKCLCCLQEKVTWPDILKLFSSTGRKRAPLAAIAEE